MEFPCNICKKYFSREVMNIAARTKNFVYHVCRPCNAKRAIDYYHKNKERVMTKRRANPNYSNSVRKATKKWLETHPEKMMEYKALYNKNMTNPFYRLDKNMRTGLASYKKGISNKKNWQIVLGYTLEDLIQRLESNFTLGMKWENYGREGWHIDHVIPLDWFLKNTIPEDSLKVCWSLKNLRPVWAGENRRKGSKVHFEIEKILG